MVSKRGALIIIEGLDRTGKTTQCKKLVETLKNKGIKAEFMNFPDRSTLTGGLISRYLQDRSCKLNDHAIHLLFSANRWENYDKMKELLMNGCTLVVDRYSYSGVAFSAIKRGMDMNWCMAPENGLLKPDLVMLLKLSDEELQKRPQFGQERYEDVNIQKKVRNVFNSFAENEDNWRVIDASETIDNVHGEMLSYVIETIEKVQSASFDTLNFPMQS